ncbi:hypothetical protein Dsin_032009 [Dipteronia sinensis]|uniref:CCHC-type domain-containing protein n=1 Tax=Dipteronia sinensis TaxID=43782 RepID=A0AAD9ZN08_9ROSI|nr:hypothetical protein Dsin_032009 [Dipteronia sinensis]
MAKVAAFKADFFKYAKETYGVNPDGTCDDDKVVETQHVKREMVLPQSMITDGSSPSIPGTRTVPYNDVPRPFKEGFGKFPSGVKYVDILFPGGIPYGPSEVPLAEPTKDKWMPRGKKGSAQDFSFNLPKRTHSGRILVVGGVTPQFWPDIIAQWENDLLAAFKSESREFVSSFDLWDWAETFLDPYSKTIFNTFKGVYPDHFTERIGSPDDINITNFTLLVRTLLVGPEAGHPDTSYKQMNAQVKLKRLTCDKIKQIIPYSLDYYAYSAEAGLSMSETAAKQYMFQLPGHVGQAIRDEWNRMYNNIPNDPFLSMVPPRISFTFSKLREMCIERAKTKEIAKSDYGFCSSIYTGYSHMDYYNSSKKSSKKSKSHKKTKPCKACTASDQPRYSARKTPHKGFIYKGKKGNPNDKIVRGKNRCYNCNKPGHIVKNCPEKKTAKIKVALDLAPDIGYNFASVTKNSDSDSIASDVDSDDSIYSISYRPAEE